MNNTEVIAEAKRIITEEIKSLSYTRDLIDIEFFDAVQLISNSKKVIISGVGKSGIIGKKISASFASIGIPSFFLHPDDALHGDIGIVEKDDVVILLSKSGATEEIIKLVPYLKSRNAKIISIVGNMKSYLANESDIVLNGSVEKEACPLNIMPTSSTVVSLAIGDALAGCLIKIKNISIERFSRQHPLGQIGKNITLKVKDVMHKNKDLPIILPNQSFKESIIEISNKKLGCVCVVDYDYRLYGIITDGDVRRILQRYDEIKELKAENIMTVNPITINENELLSEALSIMENRESQISVLPVVNNDRICIGVIRLHDIIRSGIS